MDKAIPIGKQSNEEILHVVEELASIVGHREVCGYEYGFDTYIDIDRNDLPVSFMKKYGEKVKKFVVYHYSDEFSVYPVTIYTLDALGDTPEKLLEVEYDEFIKDESNKDLLLVFFEKYRKLAIDYMRKKIKELEGLK